MERARKRKLKGQILIFLGIINILYFFVLYMRRVTFSKFFAAVGLVFIIVGAIKLFYDEELIKKRLGFIFSIVKFFTIVMVISFVILEGIIISYGAKSDNVNADYVVVLGAGLRGEIPSQTLSMRMDKALDYLKKYKNSKVILSGGKGPGETITEAEAMRKFFIKNGIDEKRLIKEEKSTNTMENLKYTKKILQGIDQKEQLKVMLVTSNFHMFRAKFLAERNGLQAYGCPADIPNWLAPTYYTREYFAVVKSFLFDKNTENKNTLASAANTTTVAIGKELDSYKGVAVYNNGAKYTKNYGKNYSSDGYYYGYKWQCVEFVKRFYYEVKNHKMPDGFGNAKDFFDVKLEQGEFNKTRGLYQYKNGGKIKPEPDDLIVFNDTKYGHVAIVIKVADDYVEVIQQNIYGKTRQRLEMHSKDGKYIVGTNRKPVGWLRKISK